MTRDEFRDLAELWSAATPTDDHRDLERLARRTPRTARMALWGELAVVILLAATILLSIASNLGLATLLTGSLVLVLLAWSAWKRHHLGNVALMVDQSDRLTYIYSLVRAKEAELNRSAVGLALILPGTLITMLFAFSLHGPNGEWEFAAFLAEVLTTPRGLITLGFWLCALLLYTVSHIRLVGELGRLRLLRDDYAREARRDRFTDV